MDLREKAAEIAKKYENLPMQDKIGMIAQSFGCTSGVIETSPCYGEWNGNSDMYIQFDNGTSLHIGNYDTLQAATDKVQYESVTRAFLRYNPEIVAVTKGAALAALRKREVEDNMIAAQKGLKPYTLLNVELASGTDDRSLLYTGWYYVTLAVDGKIHAHLETGLDHEIAHGKVSETPSQYPYFVAGAIKESEVDYVFDNVGHSSTSTLYSLPMTDDVLRRAEKTLVECCKASEQTHQRKPSIKAQLAARPTPSSQPVKRKEKGGPMI